MNYSNNELEDLQRKKMTNSETLDDLFKIDKELKRLAQKTGNGLENKEERISKILIKLWNEKLKQLFPFNK